MWAIYAFCREVDDIADGIDHEEAKRQALAQWRHEIDLLYEGKPERLTARALLEPVRRFRLPKDEFIAMIDGMEIDATPSVTMQTKDELLGYCRKVAGSVGVLSVHAFGVPDYPGPRIAEDLGNALQLTNILRDLREDAERERLYVPRELLAKHGVKNPSPGSVFQDPGFSSACAELAGMAHDYFDAADQHLRALGWRAMRPAATMMAIYREVLRSVEERGWNEGGRPARPTATRRMFLGLRYGLF